MVPGWSEAMNDEKKPPVVSGAVGTVVPARWQVEVDEAGVQLRRVNRAGFPIECYTVVSHARAAVWLAAIAHGFQPPRDCRLTEPEGPGGY